MLWTIVEACRVGRGSFLGYDMLVQAIVAEDAAGAGLHVDGRHARGIAREAQRAADVIGIAGILAAEVGATGGIAREDDLQAAARFRAFDRCDLRCAVQHG